MRPRRDVKSSKASVRSAIQQLVAVKKGNATRVDQYEVAEEEPVYDNVGEDEYRKIVTNRRKGQGFVVDDGGLGYEDDGEEEFSDESDEETRKDRKRAREVDLAAASAKGKKKGSGVVPQSTLITSMLMKPAGVLGPHSAPPKPKEPEAAPELDDALEDMLGDLDKPAAADDFTSRLSSLVPAMPRAARGVAVAGPRRALFDDDAAAPAPDVPDYGYDAPSYDDDYCGYEPVGEGAGAATEAAEEKVEAVAPPPPPPEVPVIGQAADKSKWKVTPKQRAQALAAAPPSKAPGEQFDPAELMATLGDVAAPAVMDSAETLSGKQLGDLPLSAEGTLLMFWLDAYEDPVNMPGTLYLFGKVLVKKDTYASCCVGVTGLERHVFILPRARELDSGAPVTAAALLAELKDTMLKVVPVGKGSTRTRKVRKNYAFELPDVPREETDYVELVYGYKFPPLPSDLSGRTFSKCFGTRTSALETLLLYQDIMGPCWLEIKNVRPASVRLSYCVHEVTVEAPACVVPLPSSVRPPPAPPASVVSLSLKTVVNPKTHAHEVVAASILYHPEVNMDGPTPTKPRQLSVVTAVTCSSQLGISALPVDLRDVITREGAVTVKPMPNERALLTFLISRISELDPDVLLGHNILGFDMDVLLHRISHNAVPNWSSIGRLRRKQLPRLGSGSGGQDTFLGVLAAGRLICDTYLSSRELLRETTYTLSNLAKTQLGVDRREVDPLDVPRFFVSSPGIIGLCRHTEHDAQLALNLMFKLQVLPLTKQLTNLAGNLWSRSLRGARAERIEYLLLHTFHRAGYIVPDKEFTPSTKAAPGAKPDAPKRVKTKKKPAYSGGLVLEPRVGLYDKFVLLLDFNSLYPSIIQEYNICFTTVERPATGHLVLSHKPAVGEDGEEEAFEEEGEDGAAFVPALPDTSKHTQPGILPRVIRTLVEKRREVKKMMKGEKDATTYRQLDIRQLALKILANSMYGCLGFSSSRFYAKPIAALVTSQGREILQNTVNLARSTLNLDVIYGDTDSIMIHTNSDSLETVKKMGEEVKAAVNKLYKLLEIEMDGIFKTMLLLKKKKYAALVVNEAPGGVVTFTREMKGLDIVRRDWCVVSKELGSQVLDLILSGKDKDEVVDAIHALLTEFAVEARAGRVAVEKYVITRGLNKSPKDYPDAKSQPHLQVALRMLAAGKPVNVGDHIPYVICLEPAAAPTTGGSPGQPSGDVSSNHNSVATRAYHPDEIKKSGGNLKPDVEWYLLQQILPPISRLCGPIQETSQARLASCLGLDPSRYRSILKGADEDADGMIPKRLLDPSERFKSARPLPVICQRCHHVSTLPKVFQASSGPGVLALSSGLMCTQPGCGGLWRSGVSASGMGASGGSPEPARLRPLPAGTGRAGSPPTKHELEFCRASLVNGLILAVRALMMEYSQHWLRCDDGMCGMRTRQQPVARLGKGCVRPMCKGQLQPEVPDSELNLQLEYFHSLFSAPSGGLPDLILPHVSINTDLRAVAAEFLSQNAYHVVDADSVFGYVDRMKAP